MNTTVSSVSKYIITIEVFYIAKTRVIDDQVCARELQFLLNFHLVSHAYLTYISAYLGISEPKFWASDTETSPANPLSAAENC